DSLWFVCVENPVTGASVQHRGQLPREVHGVPDAGVHALPADRAVNVRGITHEEHASASEMVGHSMMDVVGGEPVHASYIDTHPLDHAPADILPGQRGTPVRSQRLVSHRANQAGPTWILQRKHGKKIGAVERDMDIPV